MGPPLLSRMYGAAGELAYLDLMHKLYWDSADYLYDKDDHLFFRDASNFFPAKKSPAGKKVFWSRGNGWVYAGLVRTLDFIPPADPQRQKYLDLYKQMSDAIVSNQQPDGYWCSSLTEPAWVPGPEASGTSFFTFGLLAGINRHWIDEKTYLPPALKGWVALNGLVAPDGTINFSQGVGSTPAPTKLETHMDYTQGAYLMAASEILRLEGAAKTPRRQSRSEQTRANPQAPPGTPVQCPIADKNPPPRLSRSSARHPLLRSTAPVSRSSVMPVEITDSFGLLRSVGISFAPAIAVPAEFRGCCRASYLKLWPPIAASAIKPPLT